MFHMLRISSTVGRTCRPGVPCRKVVARAQVKEREVSPPPPGTLQVARSEPEQQAVLRSLEMSFSGPPHSHAFPPHRSWGLWEAGASHADCPSERGGVSWCCKVSSHGAFSHSGRRVRGATALATTGTRASTQGRVSSSPDQDVGQRMPEAEAWGVVAQWRRVVDAATHSSCTTQKEYAMEVQTLDVRTLSPSKRRELEARSGVTWKSMLMLQDAKSDAEMCLLHSNMGLLAKVRSVC